MGTPRIEADVNSSSTRRENPLSPRPMLQKLTAAAWRIIEELYWLEQCYARDHPGRNPYSVPGQEYIAAKVGVTREYVSRVTTWLHHEGFICKTFRRPVKGRWQTCMYKLASAVGWRIRKLLNLLSLRPDRVNNTAHKATYFIGDSLTPRAARAIQAAAPP